MTLVAPTDVAGCPLCRATDRAVIRKIAYAQIWEALRVEWGVDVDKATRRRHEPARSTHLVRCGSCSLLYFFPSRAGDEGFYRLLSRSMPEYAPERWEFDVVRRELQAHDELLDLGCADGQFLRSTASLVRRVAGVDQNAEAIAMISSAGLEAHASDFVSFAESHESEFDVVCSFQTLEHMPDVAALVEPVRRALRPGGRFFVSAPNGERLGRQEVEGLDCPPHHVSRWERARFQTLGDRFGFRLVRVAFEEPDLSHVRLAHRVRVERPLRPALGSEGARFAGRVFGKTATGPRRHAARAAAHRYTRRGWFGHSMLAEFRLLHSS